jgi:hypothetical protein
MASALSSILSILIFGGVIAVWLARRMPVRFRGLDEHHIIKGVAHWAAKELPLEKGDTRLFHSLYISPFSVVSWMASIPAEELAILAPFIDRMIEGKGPPLNLPAEYKDTRPETLRRFKERMQAQGLWPQSQS